MSSSSSIAGLIIDCAVHPGGNGFEPGAISGYAIGSLVLQVLAVLVAILIITLYHCNILSQGVLNVFQFLCKFVPSLYSWVVLCVIFNTLSSLKPEDLRMCGAPANSYCPELTPLTETALHGWLIFGLAIFGIGKLGLDFTVNFADWVDASVGKWFRVTAFFGALLSMSLIPLVGPLVQVPFNLAGSAESFCFVTEDPKSLVVFVQVQGFLVIFLVPIGMIIGYLVRCYRYPRPANYGQVDVMSLGGIRHKFEAAFPAFAERVQHFGKIDWQMPSRLSSTLDSVYSFLNQVYIAFYLMLTLLLCYAVGTVMGILTLGGPGATSPALAIAQFFWTGGSSAIVSLIFVGYRVIYYGCIVKRANDKKEYIERKADDWC